jgi:predicted O-methyltransferase YrrM
MRSHRPSRDRVRQLLYEATGSSTATGAAAAGLVLAAGMIGRRSPQTTTAVTAGLIYAYLRSAAAAVQREVRNSADAIAVLGALGPFAAPIGGWAIEPDFGQLIARELTRSPTVVVECGSGVTTQLIGAWLHSNQHGMLYSLEHDSHFAQETRNRLQQMGVADRVHVIDAPLFEQDTGSARVAWYAPAAIEKLPAAIDLLVVDGPPDTSPLARWPAIPRLHDRLKEEAVVLVDDGRDRSARLIAARWVQEFPDLELYWHDTVKGSWRLVKTARAAAESPRRRRVRGLIRLLAPRPSGFGRSPARR